MNNRLMLYLCVFCFFAAVEVRVWARMVRQVNQHLPKNQQHSLSIWSLRNSAWEGNDSGLWRAHQRLFPHSRLRDWYLVGLALTLLWLLFGLSLLSR